VDLIIMEIIDKIQFNIKNKAFVNVLSDNKKIKFTLNNIVIPFGVEIYNCKEIINIEIQPKNNESYNYISIIESIENKIKNSKLDILKNKNLIPSIKDSKYGKILRTHLIKDPEIYIKSKTDTKINLMKTNLKNSESNVIISLKGIWIKDDTYGLYWSLSECEIIKL
jgi:hypothetical protein